MSGNSCIDRAAVAFSRAATASALGVVGEVEEVRLDAARRACCGSSWRGSTGTGRRLRDWRSPCRSSSGMNRSCAASARPRRLERPSAVSRVAARRRARPRLRCGSPWAPGSWPPCPGSMTMREPEPELTGEREAAGAVLGRGPPARAAQRPAAATAGARGAAFRPRGAPRAGAGQPPPTIRRPGQPPRAAASAARTISGCVRRARSSSPGFENARVVTAGERRRRRARGRATAACRRPRGAARRRRSGVGGGKDGDRARRGDAVCAQQTLAGAAPEPASTPARGKYPRLARARCAAPRRPPA